MMDIDRLQALLAQRRSGFSLPQEFYVGEAAFEADLEGIFGADWIFAAHTSEIRRPGDWLTLEIGRDSIVILRDREGTIRAFHNTCRHRGSRICLTETGHANRLVCPYHQWNYDLDGSLRVARQMPKQFDRSGYGLIPAHVEVIHGMIYISIADDPPDLGPYRRAVSPYIAPHQPERTKVAHVETIVEEANWKLVIENNRECYHCAANHPELLVSLVEFALPDDPSGGDPFADLIARKTAKWEGYGLPHAPVPGGDEYRCIRLPFHEGAISFTHDGRQACRKLLGDFTDPDLGSVRMFRVPNNWNHFLSDHIIHFRVLPLAPDRTALRTTWLVHEDAVEDVDYDVETLTHVWRMTNEQDGRLATLNHRGIRSKAYRPGPYAPSEFMLTDFTNWYVRKMGDYLDHAARRPLAAE